MINIGGVDPSLTGTALCTLDRQDVDKFTVETLAFDMGKGITRIDEFGRLVGLRECVRVWLRKNAITNAFIEGYSFGSRGQRLAQLSEWGGILRFLLIEEGIPFYEVPPKTLKLYVTGNGNSNKNVMLEKTYRKWGIGSETLKDDNQVDAYGCARFGHDYLTWIETNDGSMYKEYELRSFKKITCAVTL